MRASAMGWPGLAATCLLVGSAVPPAFALDAVYGIDAGIGRSDNITRTDANALSDTIGMVGMHLSLAEQTRLLRGHLGARFQYFDYFDDSFDNEVVGGLAGDARLALVPERFEWSFQDNFGQVRRDVFAVETPENREHINYFTTGPDLTLGVGVNRLRFSGRYSLVSYEESPLDHDRVQGMVSYIRAVSPRTSLSLNASTETVKFDDESVASEFERRELYLGYQLGSRRTRLDVNLGYAELDGGSSDDGDWLLRATLSRRVSRSSTLSLIAGREFADAANLFRQGQGLEGIALDSLSIQQTGSPFISEFATLEWLFERPRTSWVLMVSQFRESYVDGNAPDRNRTSVDGRFRRNLRPTLSAELFGNYGRERFAGIESDYSETIGGFVLNWQIGRRLSAGLQYDRATRDGEVAGDEYTENRYWLRFSWGSGTSGGYGAPVFDQPALAGPTR